MKSKGFLAGALAWLLSLSACQPPLHTKLAPEPEVATRPWQLIVELKPAQSQRFLALAKQRFGASARDQLQLGQQSFSLLQLDPARVEAQPYELPDSASPQDWTRAALRDLLQHHAEMFENIELNPLPELPQASYQPGFNDLSFGIGSGLEGWWRSETQVEEAWQYSIGSGVRVAYIDQGFVRNHPELERRLVMNGQNNQTDEHFQSEPGNIEVPQGDHGTASLLVGFAERHNHLPSVGVAPNASFTPYVADSVWDVARALNTAAKFNPQVIGINFAFQLYPRWQEHDDYKPYRLLKEVFSQIARTSKIPIVLPAHNYGEPIKGGPREWVPVGWAQDFENIISVGGVSISPGSKELKAWFNADLITGINARGSNYGAGMIWAPATFLDTASTSPDGLSPHSMSGTSASCPFMTAALSIILSRLPQLSASQLRQLLLSSARAVDASELLQKPGASVPMIQLAAALRLGLRNAGLQPDSYRARSLKGSLQLRADGQRELLSAGRRYKVLPTLVDLLPGIPSRYDGSKLEFLAWTGIPPLAADEVEILEIRQPG